MRIRVSGDNPAANGLRGFLSQHGFQVVEWLPTFHIEVFETEEALVCPIVDGVDSDLERRVVTHLAELAGAVLVQRAGGVQASDELKVTIRGKEDQRWYLQRAVFRALADIRKDKKPWFGRKRS